MTTHAYRPLDVRIGSLPAGTERFHRVRVRRTVLAAVLAAVLSVVAIGGTVGADGPVPTEPYVVQSGDTLWEIAAARTASGEDVRELMADIADLSGLETLDLAVGQRLEIPLGG